MLVWLGFLLFLYLVSQGHWELLGSGILCHPLTAQESALPTVCVWLLIANHNVFQEYSATLLVFHVFIPLAPSEWQRIMILHLNQEEEKNPAILPFLCVCVCFLNSRCHSLLGLFVYMFVSSGQ